MNEIQAKRKKVWKNCCIDGCNNGYGISKSLRLYRFPTSSFEWRNVRRKEWIKAVIKHNNWSEDWQPRKSTVICSDHFAGGAKSDHPHHPGYNPTIFPGDSPVKANREAARFMRRVRREYNKVSITKPPLHQSKALSVSNATMELNFVEVEENFLDDNFLDEDNALFENNTYKIEHDECKDNLQKVEILSHFNADHLKYDKIIENNMNCVEEQVDLQNSQKTKKKTLRKKFDTVQEILTVNKPWLHNIEFCGISSITSNNELIEMCGITFEFLNLLLKNVPIIDRTAVSNPNRFLMFFMKLKQGLSYFTLSILTTLPINLISRIFTETLQNLSVYLKTLSDLPNEALKNVMPESFRKRYSNCRVIIIDCIEILTEVPENLKEKTQFYSSFKNCEKFKSFIAYSFNGYIIQKSQCYGGQKSDEFIVEDCGFLNFVESGDVILASKDFPSIKTEIENKKAVFIAPPFTIENPDETSVQIHVKECINRIKSFKILSFIPLDLLIHIDEIFQVCCSLINVQISDKMKVT